MLDMKPGDIVFVRGKGPISRIIRFYDKGDFSHVAIAVSRTHILEAQYYTKSRIYPFYFDDYEILRLDFTDEERQEVIKMGIQLCGKWYDYSQILGYLLNKPRNNPNNLICSEMVATILSELGKLPASAVINLKPNELYNLLKEHVS